jgi:hypothetical protein
VSNLTPDAMAWLASHHSVITASVLRSCGVGRSTTVRLVRAGVLGNPHKGVYVLASAKPSLELRCAVVCCAHPSGFVTGPTAGMLLGIRRMPKSAGLHFAVRHGLRLADETGVVFRQTTALLKQHTYSRSDGITTATPPRLAFDLAADLPPLDHLSALHQLLDEGRVTFDELIAIGNQLGHPARRGSGRFREALHRLGGDPAGQSHAEIILAEELHARGVPVERQTRLIRGTGDRAVRVDLAVPDIRWGIELDIHPEHRSIEGHAGDARRYRDLHVDEWQIEPVSELDMLNPAAIADELSALYQARRRQVRRQSEGFVMGVSAGSPPSAGNPRMDQLNAVSGST